MGLDGYRKVRYNSSMDKKKIKTSFSLSVKGKHLLEELAKRKGISQTGIIEMLIRKEAKEEGIVNG